MVTSEPGSAAAATIQNAADEKSPGTEQRLPGTALAASNRHRQPVDVDLEAERGEGPFRVIARLRRFGHRRGAVGVQTGEEDRALHLRAGDRAA